MLALVREADRIVTDLAALDLEVVVASPHELAAHLDAAVKPDLVLVDLAVAGAGALAKGWRASCGPSMPILVLVEPDQLEGAAAALEHGATDFVAKPISAGLLAHRVRLMIRSRQLAARAEAAEIALAHAQGVARFVQWRFDPDRRTFAWSTGADVVFAGLEGEGLVSDALLRRVHPDDRARVEASLAESGPRRLEYRLILEDGEERQVQQETWPEHDAVTGSARMAATVHDVSELRGAEGHADRLAYYDDLTDLPNRAHAERYLRAAVATAKLRRQQVAVMSIDLDLFRRIKDPLGHAGGNAVLQEIARRVTRAIGDDTSRGRRPEPLLARVGGDEFVVILRDVRDSEEVATFFRLLAARLGEPYLVDGAQVAVSCSAGVATFPENGRDVDTLFRHADAALHEAKARGRHCILNFDSKIQEELDRRHEVERRLRAALACGESLELHYQPKVEVPSGRVAGVEALLRWRCAADGPISPTELVSVAEETGLIEQLGDWVLRTACLQAKEWSERGPRGIRVAVNVSAAQFGAPGFEQRVAALLTETQLAPNLLELEITEGVMMFETAVTSRVLARLKLLGVRIAIDDFGTGYSSLAYLTRFPVDCLKIDRSFIEGIGVAEKSEAIVAAVIALARSLAIDVVAEGVETVEQRVFLERFGALKIQGWLFSKALPNDMVAAWITRHEQEIADHEPRAKSA